MQFLTPIYNRNKSEAEIQADIYCSIRELGLDPKLEVRGYVGHERHREKCIFDVVVFWPLNHIPFCIIECKKGANISSANKQIERYKKFGIPVLFCGKDSHDKIICEVSRLAYFDRKNAPPSFDMNKFLQVIP